MKCSPDPRATGSLLGPTKTLMSPGGCDLTHGSRRGRPFCPRCPAMGLGGGWGGDISYRPKLASISSAAFHSSSVFFSKRCIPPSP